MAVEPWLRGTLGDVEPVKRAVLHALELAVEDVSRWCDGLSEEEMFARPAGLPPVAFQLRHIARSLDRLLTYAEGRGLSEAQLAALKREMDGGSAAEVMEEVREGLRLAMERVHALSVESFGEVRGVGRAGLPTTVVGLLIHCAEHTQRHMGQMVTTVKVVRNKE
jgi:uncharacterized damage-inducible protein DinB